MKRILAVGITGQDGSYLAKLLLKKGYEVYGLVRRLSVPNLDSIAAIQGDLYLLDGDLMHQSSLDAAVRSTKPYEVYNLATQSFVGTSFAQPVPTCEITGLGVMRRLEAVRHPAPDARLYRASSSEMFGKVDREPQDETTPIYPRNPRASRRCPCPRRASTVARPSRTCRRSARRRNRTAGTRRGHGAR